MSPARHLVVFAKEPRLGTVKSRLAADIGAVPAWSFYRRASASVLRRLAADARWRCWLAVTPDRALALPRQWPTRYRRMAQGSGDIGRRMALPIKDLPPGPVVIVGTDVPGIRHHHIAQAFNLLGRFDAVFGPATDGGYWLVGLRRRPRSPEIFDNVRWSTRHALADTLANLGERHTFALLEMLSDVDDGEDFRRLKNASPTGL
jgi:uncharacterized protein